MRLPTRFAGRTGRTAVAAVRGGAALLVVLLLLATCTNPLKETVEAVVEQYSRPRAEPNIPNGWGIAPDTAIVVVFSETIDTSTVELSGTLATESDGGVWSETAEPDDTLTVAPTSTWSVAGAKTLTIRASDLQTYELEPLELEYRVLDGGPYVHAGRGNDDNPGTSDLPKRTVRGAVENAELVYDTAEVRIAEGTYDEEGAITVAKDLLFLGGYDEADWGVRESDPRWALDDGAVGQYPTTVRVDDTIVFNVTGDGLEVLLEHLSIENSTLGNPPTTNGVFALASAVTLRSVRVTGGRGSTASGVATNGGELVLEHADVHGATQGTGIGVLVGGGTLDVDASRIDGGAAGENDDTTGVVLQDAVATIDASFVCGGDAWAKATGVFCDTGSDLTLTNSVVLGGSSKEDSSTKGIIVRGSAAVLRNNTIGSGTVLFGTDTDGSVGISLVDIVEASMENNVIFTESGADAVRRYGVEALPSSVPSSFRNNAIFALGDDLTAVFVWAGDPADELDLNDLNDESFASGNVDDPDGESVFADPDAGDYRLTRGTSVDIRQGGLDGAAEGWGFAADKDGAPRTNLTDDPDEGPDNPGAAGWSMGAYEYD
ncbi:MAG: Ig-like domain-containing protein [Spirochaetota bacterium]